MKVKNLKKENNCFSWERNGENYKTDEDGTKIYIHTDRYRMMIGTGGFSLKGLTLEQARKKLNSVEYEHSFVDSSFERVEKEIEWNRKIIDKMMEELDCFESFGKKDKYDINVNKSDLRSWFAIQASAVYYDDFIGINLDEFHFEYSMTDKGWNKDKSIYYIESYNCAPDSVWIDFFDLKKK